MGILGIYTPGAILDDKTFNYDIPAGIGEKIRQLALEDVSWGPSRIAKELNTDKYGFIRVSTLTVWRYLRKLNLSSRKQREEELNRGN